MSYKSFEDYQVWQRSRELSNLAYKYFKLCKDYSFKDQYLRAVVSIMNNIAEGFERSGDKEFKYFLYVSKGSCGELRSMSYLALDLGYITENQFNEIFELSTLISKMLAKFITKLS
jgi:four helix bundle protein